MKLKDPSLLKGDAYINGAWRRASGGKTFPVINPADGQKITDVPDMGAEETREAIEAAHGAWKEWRALVAGERSALLKKWNDLILENKEDLATIMTAEMGKPMKESRGEVTYGASFVEWFAEEGRRVYGDVIPEPIPGERIVVIKQPAGVVAAITPWNFPIAMITRKCAPALTAGCTVVAKPAEDAPLCGLALAELAHRAGFPPGVFNVVTGNPIEIGAGLTASPTVRKITFTGSTAVGKLLMKQSADTMKKVSFELGGNAPFIVFDDADIDAAVSGALVSKYRNTGQTCVCANRILVQEGIYDLFTEKLREAVSGLTVGRGLEGETDQGPMINREAFDKVSAHISDAVSKGATVVTGGNPHSLGGLFFEPTILTGVNDSMLLAREETFGPVAPLFRFTDEEDAVRQANNTEFGLAAYVYTRDLGRTWRVSEELEYGMVGVNKGLIATAVAPFGGVKESGIGREGSKYGIEEFLEVKYICMAGI